MENVLKVSRRCLLKMTLEKVPEKFLRKQENWGSKYLPCLQDHKLSPWAKSFLILMEKYVPRIDMFCPLNVEKIREKIIFEIRVEQLGKKCPGMVLKGLKANHLG